jgi:pimeloyl-ACP methyl ester carboxylesterase
VDDVTVGRRRRRWPRRLGLLLALILAAAVAAWALGDDSAVGHYASPEARTRFLATYTRAMADLPVPERTLDVATSFGTVRVYRFAGANPGQPPLLLLPGRAAPTPVWADNLPSLLAIRPVYAIDLLGEPGYSVQTRPIAGDADQAAWLHEVLSALPEPRVHVVGLSIGGWTAMNLAVQRPARIASLTVIEPVFVFAPMSVEAIVRSIPASIPWLPRSWRDGFASWTAGGAPVEHEPIAEMIEAGMQTYRLKLPIPGVIDPARIAALDRPVLVILAGASPMHDSAAAADTARRLLRHGTVKLYPDASHAINGERPDAIAADIAAHVSRADVASVR